jgi:hypothetical protein
MRQMRLLILLLLFWMSGAVSAQDFNDTNALEVSYFTGNILPHSPDLYHLITGHPQGALISLSKQTHGKDEWHSVYNFPDYGAYFIFQDFENKYLGKNMAIGLHYNFYLLNRHLQFKIAQGIAMTTNPHDNETNYKNTAFGSKFMENTNIGVSYSKQNIVDRIGIQAGFLFTHFSNGRTKSPNSGINTYNIQLGLNYNFDKERINKKDTVHSKLHFTEPIKYNIVMRSGINESPIVGSGQKPFLHAGFYADKRLNRKSAIQLGTEVFFTQSVKGFIDYTAEAYPEENVDPDTDYKKVGIFVGHELFINRLSVELQIGYYVYQPFNYDIPVYDRFGLKYYFYKNVFAGVSVKTHGFLAEAMEYNIGIRL